MRIMRRASKKYSAKVLVSLEPRYSARGVNGPRHFFVYNAVSQHNTEVEPLRRLKTNPEDAIVPMEFTPIESTLGGVMIGIAVSSNLLCFGRVTGCSGNYKHYMDASA